jgi:hypothetical protein
MVGNDEDRGSSRRYGAENHGWSSIGRAMLHAVCTVDEETRSVSFLIWPEKHGQWGVSGSASWPHNHGQWGVSGSASKQMGRVSQFGPQNRQLRIGDLGLKIIAIISWF